MKVFGYIYCIIDQKYNKIYVGKKYGSPEDSISYFGSGIIIKDKVRGRGRFLFKKVVLGVCYSHSELNESEREVILFYRSNDPLYGYNLTNGGDGSSGHIMSEKAKDKIRNFQKGRSKSQEQVNKLKKFLKSNHPMLGLKGELSPQFGRVRSKETKELMSINRVGKQRQNIESKRKISEATTGIKNPMYGRNYFDVWVEKYGIEEANIRMEGHRNKFRKVKNN